MNLQDSILGGRRNFLQISAQILTFCHQPRSKIRVMQKVGVSFKLAEKYLLKLKSLGLLEETASGKKYVATQKGKKFLDTWERLTELLTLEEEQMSKTEKPSGKKPVL